MQPRGLGGVEVADGEDVALLGHVRDRSTSSGNGEHANAVGRQIGSRANVQTRGRGSIVGHGRDADRLPHRRFPATIA